MDTHHPKGQPSRSRRPLANRDNTILNAVACSDLLLGEFISRIHKDPRHQDTVIFVMSDRLAMRNSAWDTLQRHQNARRLLVFALDHDIQARQHQEPATHFDLGPTILDLLDVPGTGKTTGVKVRSTIRLVTGTSGNHRTRPRSGKLS